MSTGVFLFPNGSQFVDQIFFEYIFQVVQSFCVEGVSHMRRAVDSSLAAEFVDVNVVVNDKIAVDCEVGVVDDDKRAVRDFDGRSGACEKLETFKRRGKIFSVSPCVDFLVAQKLIGRFIFEVA